MRNYAGTCGFKIPETFEEMLKGRAVSELQFYLVNNIEPFLDSGKKPYIYVASKRAINVRCSTNSTMTNACEGSADKRYGSGCFKIGNPSTFVAVPYHKYWFWIDNKDLLSKQIFSFLMFIFTLVETGGKEVAPVVTVPVR